jgi:hypothetical protein
VKPEQVILPSVVAYIDEEKKPQYRTFLVEEYDTKVQIDSVCADDINQIWDSNWGRSLMPDVMFFSIDAKFHDDLNNKLISYELRKVLAEYKVYLSPITKITGDETRWRIDQSDFWYTIKKQDDGPLSFVVHPKDNAERKWKLHSRHGSALNPSIPLSSGSVDAGWESKDGKSFGSLNFVHVTQAHSDYITLYPGEVLDITKPPLISIDSKYAIKPTGKEKTEK